MKMRIIEDNHVKEVQYEQGETLLDTLVRCGIFLSAPCGGTGRCGKCKVKVLEGQAPVSPKDRNTFSQEELDSGWRLACLLRPTQSLTVFLGEQKEKDFEIIGEYAKKDAGNSAKAEREMAAAVDLGTTTLVFQLLRKDTGEIVHTTAMLNRQRKYGADVISRILASVNGKKEELKRCIQTDLREGMQNLLQESGVSGKEISSVVLGGNTIMIHLLMGYDCSKLGVYPFEPVNVDFIRGTWGKLIENDDEAVDICHDADLTILPGISAFVGGDIAAGIYASDMDSSDDISLLVDLGTNGEMALGNKERILTTSTAAGPAFEGGNISCGTGSVAGAVCSVTLEEKRTIIKTIRDQAPVGICGTGVVELVSELLRTGKMDETGLLDEIYEEQGFPVAKTSEEKTIFFTQKDVRELQLAKAAIRAGVEVLLKRYGIVPAQVEKVYLAGGFGYKLDIDKAIAIGMFPEAFRQKVQAVGNSCMAGAVKFLTDEQGEERVRRLVQISEEVNLAMDAEFQEHYMEAMMFE